MRNKILIVEDEFVVANALRLAVQQAGYRVTDIVASAGKPMRVWKNKNQILYCWIFV